MKFLNKSLWLMTLLMLLTPHLHAQVTNLYNYQPTSGTSNSTPFTVTGIYLPTRTFLIQSGAITNLLGGSYATNGVTNNLTYNIQLSIDANNSNWVTVASFNPFGTNGEVDSYTPSVSSVSLPMRVQIVTTNTLSAGVFKTQ